MTNRLLLAITFVVVPLNLYALDDAPIPNGKLGFRLGTYLTIEGNRTEERLKGGNLVVDTVNGKKLDEPVSILIEGTSEIPLGIRFKINGYETGRMIGVPDEVAKKENIALPQGGWQFYRSFIATSVVAPTNLKIIRKGFHPEPAADAPRR